jgi:hypothetical protein
MKTLKLIFGICLLAISGGLSAQGLEGIIVEKYYSSNAGDAANATAEGATTPLTVGSTTYRIYVDMAAGYKFSAIYGSAAHNLTVSSTSNFFNDPNFGVTIMGENGTYITGGQIVQNTSMLDSYFTAGGASAGKAGVAKSADTDGALVNVDGILVNDPGACFGLNIQGAGAQDGLINSSPTTVVDPNALGIGSSLSALEGVTPGNSILFTDATIAALGGIVGPTADNRVFIGQFTTAGNLSFALNVQIVNIATGVASNYVSSAPTAGEQTHPTLVQTVTGPCPVNNNTDTPDGAALYQFSSNTVYPNCLPISGNLSAATNSPESTGGGSDLWYRFVAQSTGISITLSSSTHDDIIELYEKIGPNYVLMTGGVENASSGNSDFERLNFTGLTPGTTYYVSVGSASGSGGAFTLCFQHLMPSGCSLANPVNGFNLCSTYKAIFRGSVGQGVNYDFTFTGVGGGASGSTSLSNTNGLITLSNPALGLRYGGIYDVTVDIDYSILPSTGAAELITVLGTAGAGNCNDVTISAQPLVEVRSSQRCNASLLRGNFLIGNPISGSPYPCGAINYTYEFSQVVSCIDGTSAGAPQEFTTANANPFLPLGVLPNLANTGAWNVRIRPNFSYGSGTYGPTQRIQVVGTSASATINEEIAFEESERSMDISGSQAAVYPNPNNGELLNINFTGLESAQVEVRIIDALGRTVYNSAYSVDSNLNTIVNFAQPLTSGVYLVELRDGSNVQSEKLIVQ